MIMTRRMHPIADVLVIVPGIMGSTLFRADQPIWAPTTGALLAALRSRFRSIRSLKLPMGIGDGPADDGVTPKALFPDIRLPLGLWTFDLGYTRLLSFLTSTFDVNSDPGQGPCNLVAFPYDWRLSNRYNGTRLKTVAEDALGRWRDSGSEHENAKLVFICHSMGGLVARWYVDRLGGSSHTRAVITLGTPHRGSLRAVDALSNGIRKGPRFFRVDLTEFGRSLPSLYQLLPEYACVEAAGPLQKLPSVTIQNLDSKRVHDAMEFHDQLATGRAASKDHYFLHPIGGFKQPTLTTARLSGGRLEGVNEIGGQNEFGDGTVPRLSFTPKDLSSGNPCVHYVADNHAGLVHNQVAFNQLEGILTANPVVHLAPSIEIGVETPEVLEFGDRLTVRATIDGPEVPLEVVVATESGSPLGLPVRLLRGPDDVLEATPPALPPGCYRVTVRGVQPHGAQVSPVTTVVLVWPSEGELNVE